MWVLSTFFLINIGISICNVVFVRVCSSFIVLCSDLHCQIILLYSLFRENDMSNCFLLSVKKRKGKKTQRPFVRFRAPLSSTSLACKERKKESAWSSAIVISPFIVQIYK